MQLTSVIRARAFNFQAGHAVSITVARSIGFAPGKRHYSPVISERQDARFSLRARAPAACRRGIEANSIAESEVAFEDGLGDPGAVPQS